MSDIIVHSIPGSPYGRAVLATLEEKQLPYRLVALEPGHHRSASHLTRHPFGKIPAIEHDGFTLYETQAILRYLDRIKPEPALSPTDLHALARMDQMMNINDCYLFRGVSDVISFQRVVGPRLMGLVPDEAAIEAAMPHADLVFAQMERQLAGHNFFAGDDLSLADMMIAPQVDFLVGTPEWPTLTRKTPNVVGWMERMNQRASMQVTTWARVAEMDKAA